MYKFILCLLLLLPINASSDQIKLLMSLSPTSNLIAKQLDLPVVTIMMENKDGSPLIRAGESIKNSMILAGANQFADYPLFVDPSEDMLNNFSLVSYIGKMSFALAASSKETKTIEQIVSIAKLEHRSVKMGGNGFNNICHFMSSYLTKYYNVPFDFIEYKKQPQLDVDQYNNLVDVSCKFGSAIEEESRRKYYNIILNFSKNDQTGSLKGVPVIKTLPDLSSSYILFGNIDQENIKLILESIKGVKSTEWFDANHIFLEINYDEQYMRSVIINRRIDVFNLIKDDPYFIKKIKNKPREQ